MCSRSFRRCVQWIREKEDVDAFMCSLQSALAKITALRFCSLSVRLGMVGRELSKHGQKGAAVANVIEFYVPSNFQWEGKWILPQGRGKIIEFSRQTRKSA